LAFATGPQDSTNTGASCGAAVPATLFRPVAQGANATVAQPPGCVRRTPFGTTWTTAPLDGFATRTAFPIRSTTRGEFVVRAALQSGTLGAGHEPVTRTAPFGSVLVLAEAEARAEAQAEAEPEGVTVANEMTGAEPVGFTITTPALPLGTLNSGQARAAATGFAVPCDPPAAIAAPPPAVSIAAEAMPTTAPRFHFSFMNSSSNSTSSSRARAWRTAAEANLKNPEVFFRIASAWTCEAVPMRLLVVEDEKQLATLLKRGLEAEGFAVDVGTDGEQGLWLATENGYDAIVLDIMLPKVNGYQICAHLRDSDDWTPILMLTAKDGEYDEAEALDTGADDYLTKPFSYVVLVARLRALIRRGQRERPARLRLGDLTVDPAARRCSRGDADIHLTSKEFAVLEYLARRAGEVVAKTEIVGHVWDFAYDGDPNIVEVYVSALRRKIDAPFGRTAIETIRGAGYRLAPGG
jgi:DNA-binding response OmpR family regulator